MKSDYKVSVYNGNSELVREITLEDVVMNVMQNTVFFNNLSGQTVFLVSTSQFSVIVEKV
jgi:hypothetical protein